MARCSGDKLAFQNRENNAGIARYSPKAASVNGEEKHIGSQFSAALACRTIIKSAADTHNGRSCRRALD